MGLRAGRERQFFFFMVLYQLSFSFYTYQSVYLQNCGFTASQLGLVNALTYVCGIAFTLGFGFLSDRLRSLKRVLLPVLAAGAICYAAVPLVPTGGRAFWPAMLVLVPLCGMLKNAGYSLSDNVLVRGCAEGGYNYGLIRGCGSLSFAVGCLVSSWLVPYTGAKITFWLLALFSLPVALCLQRLPDPAASVRRAAALDVRQLLRARPLVVFLLFMLLYYLGSRTESDFLVVYMGRAGLNTDLFGLINCYRAALEFPMLFLMLRLRRRFSLPTLTLTAAGIMLLECLLLPRVAVNIPLLLAVETLVGLAGGLLIGSATNYVNQVAPPQLQATAAACLTVISSIAGILGNLFGGWAFDHFDCITVYNALAGLFLCSMVCFIALSRAAHAPARR